MIYRSVLRAWVDLVHSVPGLADHANGPHGHRWCIDLYFEGDPLAANGMAVLSPEGRTKILAVIREYQDRDLNELIGAAIPSLEGFSLHLLERLRGIAPNLVRLNVFDSLGHSEYIPGFDITT